MCVCRCTVTSVGVSLPYCVCMWVCCVCTVYPEISIIKLVCFNLIPSDATIPSLLLWVILPFILIGHLQGRGRSTPCTTLHSQPTKLTATTELSPTVAPEARLSGTVMSMVGMWPHVTASSQLTALNLYTKGL